MALLLPPEVEHTRAWRGAANVGSVRERSARLRGELQAQVLPGPRIDRAHWEVGDGLLQRRHLRRLGTPRGDLDAGDDPRDLRLVRRRALRGIGLEHLLRGREVRMVRAGRLDLLARVAHAEA